MQILLHNRHCYPVDVGLQMFPYICCIDDAANYTMLQYRLLNTYHCNVGIAKFVIEGFVETSPTL